MPTFEFLLFVSAKNAADQRVVEGLTSFCERHLEGQYKLTVVDVQRERGEADRHRVLATPTLIKRHPLPEQRLVGGVWEPQQLLSSLGLATESGSAPPAQSRERPTSPGLRPQAPERRE